MTTTTTRLTDLPKPGAYSPHHGGIFIGVLLGTDGQLYGQILARKEDYSAIEGEWGCYGTKLTGADSYDDGLTNTRAMAAAGSSIAAQVSGLRIAGLDDWHIPARLQGLLAHDNAREHLPGSWIWTSTQDDAHYAWYQDSYGNQYWNSKNDQGAVVPVRRFLVI